MSLSLLVFLCTVFSADEYLIVSLTTLIETGICRTSLGHRREERVSLILYVFQ